MQSVLPGVVLK
ncbi:hypothetical protein EJO50_07825 [Iodobacter ciconiae]|uniref:Uncharacterized protein n=1 Tax=Iodobacter ciconiae TaxID=2496266 RepID=A0A3S8ZX95_9NEIS|nr:hypothetical protein EJO50_07825 [Iodobacter ciconiae]